MKIILFVIAILLSKIAFPQQDSTGVYLTASDLIQHRLSLAEACKNLKEKIKFRGKSTVIVETKDRSVKYKKSSIYGVRLCQNRIYRFFQDNDYRLINSRSILLYEIMVESGTGMSQTFETYYYFSISAETPLIALTIENLKKSFPGNLKFHDFLDARFNSDSELSEFDVYTNQFKLIRYFEESLKP